MESQILIEQDPSPMKLEVMGVDAWPLRQWQAATFEQRYESTAVCYLLSGEARVTPAGGRPVTLVAGDLVTFLPGVECIWEISAPLCLHWRPEGG